VVVVKDKFWIEAKDAFDRAGILLATDKGEYGRDIAKAILASPNHRLSRLSPIIQSQHYETFFHDLLNHQVFASHGSDHSLSFESRLAENFAISLGFDR
jgi:hypothetical protein